MRTLLFPLSTVVFARAIAPSPWLTDRPRPRHYYSYIMRTAPRVTANSQPYPAAHFDVHPDHEHNANITTGRHIEGCLRRRPSLDEKWLNNA